MDAGVSSGITGLITMSGVGLFVKQAPSLRELRRAHAEHDTDLAADLHVAEVMASSTMILAGVAVSAMTKSPAPAYLAIATSIVIIVTYEWAFRQTGEMNEAEEAWAKPRTDTSHPLIRSAGVGVPVHPDNN